MKTSLCKQDRHDWSDWNYFCNQHGNGLLIKYCKCCGEARVKPVPNKESK